jgi:predicted PhzF superfamily epimerase YddE/YHI9
VFDLTRELDFAGHPLLGAACVLHSRYDPGNRGVWTFLLRTKTVNVITTEQHLAAMERTNI